MLIYVALAMVIISFIFLVCAEDYNEKRLRSSTIVLWPLVVGSSLLTIALTLGALATRFKLRLILGSDEILHSYNHNSPANNHHQAGAIEDALE